MKTKQLFTFVISLVMLTGFMTTALAQEKLNRAVLPIQPPKSEPITEMDARNVAKPEIIF